MTTPLVAADRTPASGRLGLAITFVVLGLALNVLLYVSLVVGERTWQNDFGAYYLAAERMLAGTSPYTAEQLGGAFEAIDPEHYLYPPFLAQVLAPVTLLPLGAAKVVWLVVCFGAAYLATWLAAGIGGARRGPARAMWCLAVTLLFPPVVMAAWQGNVGTIVSLTSVLVAGGGAFAGVGAAFGFLLKVVPGALMPAALVHGRESRLALIFSTGAIVAVGFLLAPSAWLDYPPVLLNMLAGGVEHTRNLALDQVVTAAGAPEIVATVARGAAVVGGLACIAASVWAALRPRGMPLAALLGCVAMLVIPGTLWFHYLAVVLPFAVMAWPRGSAAARVLLVAGSVLVGGGLVGSGGIVAIVGAGLVLVVAGHVLWRMTMLRSDEPPADTPPGLRAAS